MCCVVIYEERFCKRDEERYGDLLKIWQQNEWSFRILKMREGWIPFSVLLGLLYIEPSM